MNNQIHDAIFSQCTLDYIWQNLLEEGTTLNVTRMLEIPTQCESMVKQMVVMTVITKSSATIDCCTKTSNYLSRLMRKIEPATDMDLRCNIIRILTVKLKAKKLPYCKLCGQCQ